MNIIQFNVADRELAMIRDIAAFLAVIAFAQSVYVWAGVAAGAG